MFLLVVGGFIWRIVASGNSGASGDNNAASNHVWYSADNGSTWFAAPKNELNQVDRDGRTAYRCHVYTCDDGTTRFAACLERFAPEALKKLQAGLASNRPMNASERELIMLTGVQVAKPGGSWMSSSDPRATALMDPVCPNDPSKRAQLVLPTSKDVSR